MAYVRIGLDTNLQQEMDAYQNYDEYFYHDIPIELNDARIFSITIEDRNVKDNFSINFHVNDKFVFEKKTINFKEIGEQTKSLFEQIVSFIKDIFDKYAKDLTNPNLMNWIIVKDCLTKALEDKEETYNPIEYINQYFMEKPHRNDVIFIKNDDFYYRFNHGIRMDINNKHESLVAGYVMYDDKEEPFDKNILKCLTYDNMVDFSRQYEKGTNIPALLINYLNDKKHKDVINDILINL